MEMLAIHPGADYSTADVYDGLVSGLREHGATVHDYHLHVRLSRVDSWLNYCWRKAGKPTPKPNAADVAYRAGLEAVERALRFDVPWVLVVSGMFLHPDVLILLRRAGRRVAVLLTESPYDIEREVEFARHADIVWTNERTCVEQLLGACARASYLPHAWTPDRHSPDGDADWQVDAHDVVFVGTGFQERIETLSQVDWTGINFGLYGAWEMLGSRSPLREHLRGGVVDNATTSALYRRAKIGLNLHRQSKGCGRKAPRITTAESLNPRAYELAACGAFTVSDHRPEVSEIFGDLVPTFRDPAELGATIRAWMKNDAGRERVRRLLPAAVAGHTWTERAGQVLADMRAVGSTAAQAA